MFIIPRTLFAVLLTVIAGVFIYFHFHGGVSVAMSAVSRHLKDTGAQISSTAGNNDYTVTIKAASTPDALPPLPDISGLTVESVAEQVPAPVPGKIRIADMVGLPGVREFIKKDGRVQRLRLSQIAVTPQVIYVESGKYDFTRLYEEVKKLGGEKAIVARNGKHLLRLPILVGEGASLVISDKDTEELLLSQDDTVFIANSGELFILRTRITGWNEKEGKPSYFKDKLIFRPFLASWSGARMHIAGSALSSLGYRKGKSYGITYSTCDPCLLVNPNLPRATGSLIGNTFTDLYYGFYSYEADDIAIVGNTYIDSAVYGIDPHDRSRRLIIAGNETYGSKKKHGIIISREVNDSWIFDNYSHHNQGSGIMLDRMSQNNVIANNVSSYNAGDGLTFFESENNVAYNNVIFKNGFSGIRIRNSWNLKFYDDQISDNGGVPLVVYSLDLSKTHKDRDLEHDPYQMRAGASFTRTVIKLSGAKPAIKIDGVEGVALSDVRLLSGGAVFSDRLFSDETDIRKNMDKTHRQVVVEKDGKRVAFSQK